MYRFSNSRQRCEEIIHGTRTGVTLGEDLQADAGGLGEAHIVATVIKQRLSCKRRSRLWQDKGNISIVWAGVWAFLSYCRLGSINTEKSPYCLIQMKKKNMLNIDAQHWKQNRCRRNGGPATPDHTIRGASGTFSRCAISMDCWLWSRP